MTQPVRSHYILFLITGILGIAAIPHAAAVYTHDLPTAILNLHLTVAIVVSIHAELRRQWWKRMKAQRDLNDLVSIASDPRR